jgi:hypothetical protein
MFGLPERTTSSLAWRRAMSSIAIVSLVASCSAPPRPGGGGSGDVAARGGCGAPDMSPAERNLCKDDETFNNTVVGGAALGAIVGAIGGAGLCAATGSKSIGKCAAIGAGAGLFTGGVAGYLTAKQQQANTQHKRQIDAITDDIQQQNATLRDEIASATQVVQASRARLATLDADTRAGKISAEDARAERDKITRDIQNLTDLIHHLETQEQNFEQAGQQSGQKSTGYSKELAEMKRNIVALTQQRDALNAAMSSSAQT